MRRRSESVQPSPHVDRARSSVGRCSAWLLFCSSRLVVSRCTRRKSGAKISKGQTSPGSRPVPISNTAWTFTAACKVSRILEMVASKSPSPATTARLFISVRRCRRLASFPSSRAVSGSAATDRESSFLPEPCSPAPPIRAQASPPRRCSPGPLTRKSASGSSSGSTTSRPLLERQVRVLRLQFGAGVDSREAYVDQVWLNAYGGPGTTNLWIDDLELTSVVAPTNTGPVVQVSGVEILPEREAPQSPEGVASVRTATYGA